MTETELEIQKKRVDALKSFASNYGKDGKERKVSAEYFQNKLHCLEQWKLEFEECHSELADSNDNKDDEYFTDGTYVKTIGEYEIIHERIQNELEAFLKKLEEKKARAEKRKQEKAKAANACGEASVSSKITSPKKTVYVNLLADDVVINNEIFENGIESEESSSEDDEEEDMPATVAVMLYQRKELLDLFKMLKRNEPTTQGEAFAQLDQLKIVWLEFRSTFRAVKVSSDKKWCNGIKFSKMQSEFVVLCGRLNDVKGNNMQNANVQLPKIKLPVFDSATGNWREFKALFDKIVHENSSISDAVKVQYLKSCLLGDAAKAVSYLTPEESNYQDVYNILERRYGNKRENVGKLIDKILDIPTQNYETSSGLKNIYDTTNECIMAIRNLKVKTGDWDPLVIHILKKKLSKTTLIDYESKLSDVRELQTLESFLKYLEHRFMALLSAEGSDQKNNEKFDKKIKKNSEIPFKCTFCEKPHSVYKCIEFKQKTVKERSDWAKMEKICFVCLQKHGKNEQCFSKYMCRTCGKKHNTLLHFESKKDTVNETKTTLLSTTSVNDTTQVQVLLSTKNEKNLLPVAFVNVLAKNGEKILLKSVIDGCSQGALMTENAFQKLGISADKIRADVEGVAACSQIAKKVASITVQPHFTEKYSLNAEVIVLKKITNLSYFKDDLKHYDYLQNLLYADPTVNDDGEIDLLLGVAEFAKIVKNGLIKGPENSPIAMNSEFGWLIMGPQSQEKRNNTTKITTLISNVEIEKKISDFFISEDVEDIDSDDSDSEINDEERYCEEHYTENTKRDDDGRLNVSMAFKNKNWPELGESRKAAIATLFQLEKRFAKNPELHKQYSAAVNEAIEKGHLVLVENPPMDAHYIPHHAVFKDSTTTKLRSVYNASQKTSNGKSLNEQLAVGKMVQSSIFELILRWRESKIAVIADLEKMYKQIRLNEDQQHLQMILWRETSTERIKSYKMTTVTFGLKSSPYLAIRSLHEIAKLVGNKYPRAANAISTCFYVDDYTGGAQSVKEALLTYSEMKKAFDEFGFNLRKFVSNSADFLNCVPECDKEEQNKSFVKALGIPWNPETDEFVFKINLNLKSKPETKRQLASEIASLQYDPLGWIAPVIVKAKILLQDVWQLKRINKKAYDWDDKLPNEVIDRWMVFKSRLGAVNSIKMQRWLGTTPTTQMELHGFCDACKKAIAAVVFIRFLNQNNEINLLLVAAKTKNAPIIEQTTPKLELCAAVLLAKLVKSVRKMMTTKFEKTILWSDSRVALAWIGANPQRYKKFVATRIKKVNKLKDAQWCHIPGAINPADCASRGIFGDELVDHALWWNGPQFLREKIEYEVQSEDIIETDNERKIHTLIITSEEKINNDHFVYDSKSILPDISSYKKMQRVFAYVNRFVGYLKKNDNTEKKDTPITAIEIENATTTIIRIVQSEYYEKEMSDIEKMKKIERASELLNLNVFLDKNRILRVGGRITNNEIPFEVKHPIVIPKKSAITKLIIRDAHEMNFHAGPRLTETIIRKKFWIINGQSTIKNQLKNCVICRKYRPKTSHQMMGDLPTTRTTIVDKPFTNTMVDFTGAVQIKTSKIRNAKIVKAYICIFVCMATKAIHVELVSDMTGEAFIAALRRFIARRGAIKTMNSDNGTNFVAANRILHELVEKEKDEFNKEVANELTTQGITWKFSPPGAPHFNGLVEAGVKTIKTHLMKVLGEKKFTFEELTTILAQIEAAVNSRPLTPMSCDANDNTVLTPAHFLMNSPPMAIASENLEEDKITYLDRWRKVQQTVRNFWHHWRDEYLHTMQQRKKWKNPVDGVKENDLVLINNESAPVGKWPMGRVIKIHPGKDGLTRVATVKTSHNSLMRPITKLAPLPIVTTLLALMTICSTPIKAQFLSSDGEVLQKVFGQLINAYKSDTTKTLIEYWKAKSPNLPQSNATRGNLLYAQPIHYVNSHSIDAKWSIIMAIMGIVLFVALILALCVLWTARKRKRSTHDSTHKNEKVELAPICRNSPMQMCQQAHNPCKSEKVELAPIGQNSSMQMCQQAYISSKNEKVELFPSDQQQKSIMTDHQLQVLIHQVQQTIEQKMNNTQKSLPLKNEKPERKFVNILNDGEFLV